MDGAAMAALVVAEIKKENPAMDEPAAITFWTAICTGIIDHILAAAVITVTVPGVTPGPGTVAGTGVVSQ